MDVGLSPQRTSLAWQRTSLSIAAGACVMARLRFDHYPISTVVLCGLSLALSVWVFAVGRFRPAAQYDGRVTAAVAVAVGFLGVQELLALAWNS